VLAEVEGMQRHIAQRAQEIFRARGGTIGHAVEDWIRAERETIWRPALEVRRTKGAFVVEAAIAGIDPKQLDVQVTPTELVLGAPVHHANKMEKSCSASSRTALCFGATNFLNLLTLRGSQRSTETGCFA
jgi:HSP20 family molecular chaperone IbpA